MQFKRTICVTTVLCSLLLCTHAFADACSNLDANAQWKEGMTTMSAQMTAKNWDEALKTAETLNTICERSPILNYTMGRIYREKGNDSKSLYYYQRATLFTEEFAVKGKTLELMWFDRYEAEHPEARPDAIAARQKDIEARDNQIEMLKAQAQLSHEKDLRRQTNEQYGTLTEKAHYAAGMWTGVALMGVGAVMTGVGGYLVSDAKTDAIHYDDKNSQYNVKDAFGYKWAILGVGIAASVAGGVVTGIMGYFYTHTEVRESPVSVNISPIGGNLKVVF